MELQLSGLDGWVIPLGISGGVKYRAPYGANDIYRPCHQCPMSKTSQEKRHVKYMVNINGQWTLVTTKKEMVKVNDLGRTDLNQEDPCKEPKAKPGFASGPSSYFRKLLFARQEKHNIRLEFRNISN